MIDSALQVAYETKEVLDNEGLLNKKHYGGKPVFYVSDELQQFKKVAKNFLGKDVENLRKVSNV